MNQPPQPSPDQTASAGKYRPLQADSDPYYSIAMNVPSGPLGLSRFDAHLSQPAEQTPTAPGSPATRGHQDFQAGLNMLEEIDIRAFQLEASEPQEHELPMPIRNAFCDESTGAPERSACAVATVANESSEPMNIVSQDEAGRFIAHENSVVSIDGNDGFDYIDLSDRDIAHVSFGDSSMTVVDADTGESFTIEYQNVSRALFAHGQMIELA